MIDAHVHIFPEIHGYGPKGIIRGLKHGKIDYGDGVPVQVLLESNKDTCHTTEMLLQEMDSNDIEKAVLLLCPCYGNFSDYILDACERYPGRFTKSAFFDPWDKNAKEYYERNLKGDLWKNIKIEFSENGGLCGVYPNARLNEDSLKWLWDEMNREKKTVSFDLGRPFDRSYQTEDIYSIATTHPDLKIVLCHMGQPSIKVEQDPDLRKKWEEQIALGKLTNIWFDLSAMPYHVQHDERMPFPSTKRFFDRALEIAGHRKFLWGTDIPVLLSVATYSNLVAHGKYLVHDLLDEEKDCILEKNALEAYYW